MSIQPHDVTILCGEKEKRTTQLQLQHYVAAQPTGIVCCREGGPLLQHQCERAQR